MIMTFVMPLEKYASARFGGTGNIKPLNPSVDQQDFTETVRQTRDETT